MARLSLTSFLFALLLSVQPTFADSCEPSLTFVQKIKRAAADIKKAPGDFKEFWTKEYWPEIMRTHGRRVLTKKATDKDVEGAACFYEPIAPASELGPISQFLRDCNPVSTGYWFFKNRPREKVFQPFRGSVRYILSEPISAFTKKWFNQREVLTWPIYWPTYLVLTALPWIGAYHYAIDPATISLRDTGLIEQSQRAKPQYLKELASNYQFHDIRQKLEQAAITEQDALLNVRVTLDILNDYFSMDRDRLLVDEPTDEQIVELLKNPLFIHLSGLAANGVQPNPSLEIPPERLGAIPTKAIYMMIRETDRLYFEYQIIEDFARQTANFEETLNGNTAFTEIAKTLKDDPFTKKLEALLRVNLINREQFQYALGESAFWKTRLTYYELLGAKLKKTGGGYMTLADFQERIVQKLSGPK